MPTGTVYVGRPSRWGNPWPATEHGAAAAVARYRAWLLADAARLAAARIELAGRDLACWCRLDAPCHADVLLEFANDPTPSSTTPTSPTPGVRP
jgi:hypothetical protein